MITSNMPVIVACVLAIVFLVLVFILLLQRRPIRRLAAKEGDLPGIK